MHRLSDLVLPTDYRPGHFLGTLAFIDRRGAASQIDMVEGGSVRTISFRQVSVGPFPRPDREDDVPETTIKTFHVSGLLLDELESLPPGDVTAPIRLSDVAVDLFVNAQTPRIGPEERIDFTRAVVLPTWTGAGAGRAPDGAILQLYGGPAGPPPEVVFLSGFEEGLRWPTVVVVGLLVSGGLSGFALHKAPGVKTASVRFGFTWGQVNVGFSSTVTAAEGVSKAPPQVAAPPNPKPVKALPGPKKAKRGG